MDVLREAIEWFIQFLFFAVLFFGVVWLTGCVTPEKWRPQDHKQTMRECRVMCHKSVKSYEPLTGECACFKRSE